jgi:hypothetical protein
VQQKSNEEMKAKSHVLVRLSITSASLRIYLLCCCKLKEILRESLKLQIAKSLQSKTNLSLFLASYSSDTAIKGREKEVDMIYAYAAKGLNLPKNVHDDMKHYARSRGLPLEEIIQDQAAQTVNWKDRLLGTLLKQMQHGDSLLIYEAADIASNFKEIAAFLGALVEKEIKLHLIKYEVIFHGERLTPAFDLIHLVRHIESDFIATEAVKKELKQFLPFNPTQPSFAKGAGQ